MSVKNKSIEGIKWTTLNTVFNAFITPIFYILLAVFLSPTEFAYIAVITLFFRIIPIIPKFGIEEAYIKLDKISKLQNTSLLMFNIFLTSVFIVILYFSSSSIETFYGLENLSKTLKILMFGIFFESLEVLFVGALKRNFLFKEITLITMSGMLVRTLTTIVLITMSYSIYSYAIGIGISTLLKLILYVFITHKCKVIGFIPRFNYNALRKLLKFGFPVTLKSLLTVGNQRVDEVIIGAFLNAEQFGIYYFGKNLMTQVYTAITQTFSSVLLPLYSKLAESIIRLKDTYYKIIKFTSLLGFPILIGIVLTADLFVPIIFGSEWEESVIVIQILFIAVSLPIITGNNAVALLYSMNKPTMVLKIETITSLIYLLVLIGGLQIKQSVLVVVIIHACFLVLNALIFQYYVNKQIHSNFLALFVNMKSVISGIILMIISIYFIKNFLIYSFGDINKLIIIILIGAIIYVSTIIVIDKKSINEIYTLVKR
ncbi:oligosaccharide flippase family protein [Pseudogracilibacillus sp. ICA-222130]|uniref:oligosaccharide flippase family protein n=1 Tax=Pseudogracilibacillus sp. ICA-222130 TaxID=3134655 RepID=UPI0030BFB3A4